MALSKQMRSEDFACYIIIGNILEMFHHCIVRALYKLTSPYLVIYRVQDSPMTSCMVLESDTSMDITTYSMKGAHLTDQK